MSKRIKLILCFATSLLMINDTQLLFAYFRHSAFSAERKKGKPPLHSVFCLQQFTVSQTAGSFWTFFHPRNGPTPGEGRFPQVKARGLQTHLARGSQHRRPALTGGGTSLTQCRELRDPGNKSRLRKRPQMFSVWITNVCKCLILHLESLRPFTPLRFLNAQQTELTLCEEVLSAFLARIYTDLLTTQLDFKSQRLCKVFNF